MEKPYCNYIQADFACIIWFHEPASKIKWPKSSPHYYSASEVFLQAYFAETKLIYRLLMLFLLSATDRTLLPIIICTYIDQLPNVK